MFSEVSLEPNESLLFRPSQPYSRVSQSDTELVQLVHSERSVAFSIYLSRKDGESYAFAVRSQRTRPFNEDEAEENWELGHLVVDGISGRQA